MRVLRYISAPGTSRSNQTSRTRWCWPEQARHRVDVSQSEFAKLIGVSVRTLQEWEQGRRVPTGAARTLLRAPHSIPKRCATCLEEK
ncbi:helix-turn-helix domain-containing protein [Billgrantia endophytica]|uniref:helix-turn-helix domain-containing protein n=1 Tax=Billgrantia endophytica TaxID=2033802 RepID=UPI003BEEE9A1